MRAYDEFLQKQESIYAKSRAEGELVKTAGIRAWKPGLEGCGAYFIAWLHDEDVAGRMEEFASKVAKAAPAIAYESGSIHTTNNDHLLGKDFEYDRNTELNMMSAVGDCLDYLARPEFDFGEWILSKTTVYAASIPSDEFIYSAYRIQDAARPYGFEFKLPWGAHATTNRFIEDRKAAELGELFELMREAPVIGKSRPERLGVGHFYLDKDGFRPEFLEIFKVG